MMIMKSLSCPACNAVNAEGAAACSSCGASLAAANFAQNIQELEQLTERLRQFNAPGKSFNSFNGCGTMLLDYRARKDGTYEAIRWVTVFFLPIIPLSAYVIEPTSQEFSYGREVARFSIVDQAPLSVARVLRTYLLAVIGLAPVILGFLNSSTINHLLSGPKAFLAMLLTIAWGIYIIFFRLKNEGKAYKRKPVA